MPFRVSFSLAEAHNLSPQKFDAVVRAHYGGAFVTQSAVVESVGIGLVDYSLVHAALSASTYDLSLTKGSKCKGTYLGLSGPATVNTWTWDNHCLTVRNIPGDVTPEHVVAVLRGCHVAEPDHVLVFHEKSVEDTLCALTLYPSTDHALQSYAKLLSLNLTIGNNRLSYYKGNVVTPTRCDAPWCSPMDSGGAVRATFGDILRSLAEVSDGTKNVMEDDSGNIYIV